HRIETRDSTEPDYYSANVSLAAQISAYTTGTRNSCLVIGFEVPYKPEPPEPELHVSLST
ncbi:hypothetical protein RSAG8_07740, partial [Rhizoctonia solani AG-8 WAC10335]